MTALTASEQDTLVRLVLRHADELAQQALDDAGAGSAAAAETARAAGRWRDGARGLTDGSLVTVPEG